MGRNDKYVLLECGYMWGYVIGFTKMKGVKDDGGYKYWDGVVLEVGEILGYIKRSIMFKIKEVRILFFFLSWLSFIRGFIWGLFFDRNMVIGLWG